MGKKRETNAGKEGVKRVTIDLTGASEYGDREHDKLIAKGLSDAELFSKKFLYSVFNGKRVKQVLRTGNYREPVKGLNLIFAFKLGSGELGLGELVWDDGVLNSIKLHSKKYTKPAIAVYDASCFSEAYDCGHGFVFNDVDKAREAVRGIAFLKIV